MRAFLFPALLALASTASVGGRPFHTVDARSSTRSFNQDASGPIIDVTAERFSFTPSEIKTTAGATLQIRLHSEDTDHGFRIVGTDVNISIPKRGRGTASVTFTPEKPGRYTFECSHVCGAGHSFMRGVIVVRER